jgi:hypothetical protein
MTRLTKMALFSFGITATSVSTFFLVYIFVGWQHAAPAAILSYAPFLLGSLLKRKRPEWDEMEQKIIARSQEASLWIVIIFLGVAGMSMASSPLLRGSTSMDPGATAPFLLKAWYYIGGLWLVGLGNGVALLRYQRKEQLLLDPNHPFRGLGLLVIAFGACLMTIGDELLEKPEWTWLSESKGFGGYAQVDEWRVSGNGMINAHSRILLDRWPLSPSEITITLPYEEGEITAAVFGGEPVDFTRAQPGIYEAALPGHDPREFDIDSPPVRCP